ncbi:MAG: mannose-1-phosphate guanylyltransferase/mannose-6-phosphate isomerase [Rhodocyclaceae bacterium]|nr:mannose-1-phosphate guanylyltransferase/mannose-6-phosphate isomerase [Rhodocyclaceae bacterium]
MSTAKIPVQPVILCGGSGTRLWPLSRAGFPKQFLCLTGNESLFQQAAQRLAGLGAEDISLEAPIIVSNEEHRFLVLEQLREAGIKSNAILLEPVGRNTAPALTLAALAALDSGNDPILVVTPADQTVTDQAAFTDALQQAVREAASGSIVILGIAPDRPETGYGYIKVAHGSPRPGGPRDDADLSLQGGAVGRQPSAQRGGDPAIQASTHGKPSSLRGGVADAAIHRPQLDPQRFTDRSWIALPAARNDELSSLRRGIADVAIHPTSHTVERFVEKPDATTAQHYLDEGGYFWNAGMFVLRASTWLSALEHYRPDIAQATLASWEKRSTDQSTGGRFVRPGSAEFIVIPAESVDYAVMEHCPGSDFPIKMVPLDAGWSDLGAWDAVWQVLPKDEAGNAHFGDVLTTDSRNTLVHATSRLVSLVGVQDLVVIETADAVLVAERSRSQDVKAIVAELHANGREEHTLHRKVHRPWGWYDSIDEGGRFKVKRIQVKPKASLSLQKHHHRAEHWIVVIGTAEITCGEKIVLLTENQSTYIPLGETHRLVNPGTIPLEIIEVQSGSYLGEDDIVRFEDNYGRNK